ncbi:DNA (cytosine-5)-methyltransferase CMT1-like [Lolium rigidum]|uniref:DNA (cytosine-5)-methyltransferase CMT1-like n=1 Tax=Lolium rigidum TaxID=89674 RepID=UPI001F5C833F|nr:DNA (cytosine-5)-methyltransferase CMT1-like [Lolium rigidum]
MSPVTPSPATEPRRSVRLRSTPADANADPDADAEPGTRGVALARQPERGASRSRGKRQRKAEGEAAAATRGSAVKDADQPVGAGVAPAAGMMEVDDAGTAINDDICAEEPDAEDLQMGEEEEEEDAAVQAGGEGSAETRGARKKRVARPSTKRKAIQDHFVGEPIPDGEARQRWPERYAAKGSDSQANRSDAEEEIGALRHYTTVCVDEANFHLEDDVYVKAAPGEDNYIGRITELFEGIDHGSHFTCRWFFRVEDTVISPKLLEVNDHKHDRKRVFLSEEKNDNMIESIISKVNIIYVSPNMTPEAKAQLISKCDLYYDMSYSVAYSTFANMPPENGGAMGSEAASDLCCDDVDYSKKKPIADIAAPHDEQMETATLLDLYSGCGAMSTGLCLGAAWSGLKLNTKWAVDMNTNACNSLKQNHTFTQVRNEKAEDFLSLLRHWDALCKKYDVHNRNSLPRTSNNDEDDENENLPEGTFEVEKLVDICYGDPNSTGKAGLWFKVRWKTYDPSYDTWEPSDGLSDSPERIKEFVESGYRESILPLPGCVDVICGGPPCQGISGLNRFRNYEDPLMDERNKQLIVFMDIVNYLRPKYVLMENVVDILKFADGFLGRYALSRLVAMSYQARLGMMVAGCYGLPQFRMRVFLWGALPSVVLPKFPLPTHDVINRGVVPNAFSQCLVAYNETEDKHLKEALVIRDAISDLPKVGNHQPNDVMDHRIRPKTEFQHYIRLNRKDMKDYSLGDATHKEGLLFDHQPLQLNNDDYERVQQIPVKKGANFRDLKGVRVGENNTVEFDPDIPRVLLSSGKPLVPSYAMTFIKGKSVKPFGRLWWDETVATVVTRAEPHNQIVLHPSQHRVLTIRENARLQGFPDYYRLSGPIKQKYIQVGNAVAVPVARALGYSLGQAYQGEFDGDYPLFKLPGNFIPMDQATLARLSEGTSGGKVVEAE